MYKRQVLLLYGLDGLREWRIVMVWTAGTTFPKSLRHAENQAGIARGSSGQKWLPKCISNKRSISYLGALLPDSIYLAGQGPKCVKSGSNQWLWEATQDVRGQKVTFSTKMTHALSIDTIIRC